MKNLIKKANALKASVIGVSFVAMGSANAALDQSLVDGVVTDVLADAGIAIAAGFAIFGTVKAAKAGFGLLSSFIGKGARG